MHKNVQDIPVEDSSRSGARQYHLLWQLITIFPVVPSYKQLQAKAGSFCEEGCHSRSVKRGRENLASWKCVCGLHWGYQRKYGSATSALRAACQLWGWEECRSLTWLKLFLLDQTSLFFLTFWPESQAATRAALYHFSLGLRSFCLIKNC